MSTKAWSLVMTVALLLAACGAGTDEKQNAGKQDGSVAPADAPAARDTPGADLAPDLAGPEPDSAAEAMAPDAGPDLPKATETGAGEVPVPIEAGNEAGAADLARPADAPAEAGRPDAAGPDAAPDLAADAPAPANYNCNDDSDCCIVVDTCNGTAHLYSLAPGATGPPSFPSYTMCAPCVPPAVQVRCDQGRCVGERISSGVDYESPLREDHCGPVALPDAGAASPGQPAQGGAQPTSWGC
ncbi:MAG: hypothetical protein JXP73_05390 [Deltaproteobacteria bacterium]|nr:hypothetical protein [Deltaproteobacteria bacterium]